MIKRILVIVALAALMIVSFAGQAHASTAKHMRFAVPYTGNGITNWGPGGTNNTHGFVTDTNIPTLSSSNCSNCTEDLFFTLKDSNNKINTIGIEVFTGTGNTDCNSNATYGCVFYEFDNQSKFFTGNGQNFSSSAAGDGLEVKLDYFAAGGMNLWVDDTHTSTYFCDGGDSDHDGDPTCTTTGGSTLYNFLQYENVQSVPNTNSSNLTQGTAQFINNQWDESGVGWVYRSGVSSTSGTGNGGDPLYEDLYWVSTPNGSTNNGGTASSCFDIAQAPGC